MTSVTYADCDNPNEVDISYWIPSNAAPGTYTLSLSTPNGSAWADFNVVESTTPPWINGINIINTPVRGGSGWVEIYGTGLAKCAGQTYANIDGGITANMTYQDCINPGQVNISYSIPSNAALGTHYLSVTTPYGTSNAVTFTVQENSPTVSGVSVTSGTQVRGGSGSGVISGADLLVCWETPTVSIDDGISAWAISSACDPGTELQFGFSIPMGTATGSHTLTVTTSKGAASGTFTVYDPTPWIDSDGSPWQAGGVYYFDISGGGFGSNPSIAVSGAGAGSSGIVTSSDTHISAWVDLTYSDGGTATLTVTSNGWGGNNFAPAPGGGSSGQTSATAQIASCWLSIPADGQQYGLNATFAGATVPLILGSNCTGTATWSVVLSYQTSGGKGYSTAGPFQHNGQPNEWWDLQIPDGVGGKADVTVTLNGRQSAQATFYVVGGAIPDSDITNRLISLYSSGARPHLFTGVADKESSYIQFAQRTLYSQSARWPNESYDGGSHIGLLMMPVSMADGYSYMTNTQDGVNLFVNEKLPWCRSYVAAQRASHPALRDLTGVEYEMCGLVKYGPYGGAGPYYVPNSGFTDWIVNPNNSAGVAYADDVVGRMK